MGLTRALAAGLPTEVLDHKLFASRREYDLALAALLRRYDVDLVCLAGFMRLLGPEFVDAFPNAVLNVHPSLLPAFPGVDAQRQALEHGVKVAGCTVHVVTAELDAGPIIAQSAVPVLPADTVETLSARILVRGAPPLSRGDRPGAGGRLAGRGAPVPVARCRPAADGRHAALGGASQRQHRHFGRAVDADRHVDRADAAADEHRRVLFAADPGQHRKLSARQGADSRQHHLSSVRVAGEHQLHVQGGGLDQAAWIVSEQDGGAARAGEHPRQIGGPTRPETDTGEIERFAPDRPGWCADP